jgi:hypothetical protein
MVENNPGNIAIPGDGGGDNIVALRHEADRGQEQATFQDHPNSIIEPLF